MKKKISLPLLFVISSLAFSCAPQAPAAPHEHTFDMNTYVYDDTNHWHPATCEHKDERNGVEAHTLGDWIINKAEKVRYKECSVCDYQTTPEHYEELIPATRMYLGTNPTTSNIGVGSTRTLSPVIFPANAYKNIKYVSEDTEIIEVNNDGLLLGKAPGTALITAYNDNNNNNVIDEGEPRQYACYTIHTPDASKSITLDKTSVTLKVGEEVTITATANGFRTSFFSNYVSNSEIATAYSNKIKGLKPGTTNVNIYATPSGDLIPVEANCEVTVVDNEDDTGIRADSISFSKKLKNLTVGQSFTPEYSISPAGTVDVVDSLTSNSDCITINNGEVTASKAGSAILTIKTTNNEIDRMEVVITDPSSSYEKNYNDYYGDLTWTDGKDLANKLHNIIKNKKSLKYNNPTNWDSNKDADSLRGDSTKVSAIYSDEPIDKSSTQTGWQREHCFAATLMTHVGTGDAVKTLGRATDFHNLYASYTSGNTSRGNKNFGYANTESYRYTVPDNVGSYVYDDKNFEPSNRDKGKVARAIFYMGVMYNDEESYLDNGVSIKAQPLEVIEDYVNYTSFDYSKFSDTSKASSKRFADHFLDIVRADNPTVTDETELMKLAYQYFRNNNTTSAIGNLKDLLMWNSFSVDEQEMQHNNSVYSYNSTPGGGVQGNRNPFVDYPELVEYVYGSLQDQPGSLSNLRPAIIDLDMDIPDVPGGGGDEEEEVTFDNSKYSFTMPTSKPQDLIVDGVATWGSLTWDFEMKTPVNLSSSNGLKIGASGTGADTVTMTTKSSLEDVDAVFFKAYCASGKTNYRYDIYVGEELIEEDASMSGAAINEYSKILNEKKTGKVKIVFKNLDSYISLKGIAINYK